MPDQKVQPLPGEWWGGGKACFYTATHASLYEDYQTAYVHMIVAFVLSNLNPIFRMMEEH